MPTKTFYVDPVAIAKERGINVLPIEPEKIELASSYEFDHIDDELCGYIEKDENGKVTIRYNPHHHENRQRFTIAHELGHYILGHLNDSNTKEFRDFANNFKSSTYNPKEVAANKFAARILMPEDKLDFLIYKKGVTSIKELAKIMKVSEAAMLYRLKNLGWIK